VTSAKTLYRGHKTIWASIHENGDVRVSSEAGESECCASVEGGDREKLLVGLLIRSGRTDKASLAALSPEQKDEWILELIQEMFQGQSDAVRMFHDFAAAEGLEPGWFRWP